MYVQNDKGEYELKTTKEFPLSDYKLNTEKSSCKKGGVLSQDKRTNTVNVEVKSNDECNVYFDKETLSQRTLRILGLNYKENENINFFEPEVMDVTKDGLYSMGDDYGTSYYFRGAVENNYIKFGKNKDGQDMWWRIIRINGNGSLRIQYDGLKGWNNGESNTSRLAIVDQKWHSYYNDAKYAGWMFGGAQGSASTSYEQATNNETNSDIKTLVDEWYELNIKNTGYSKYLSDEGFCNSRSAYTNENTTNIGNGYGTKITYYEAYKRLRNNKNPSFKCNNINDLFTLKEEIESEVERNAIIGNKALDYPVGLITADEIVTAGGVNGINNTSYYLYKSAENHNWSLSPSHNRNNNVVVYYIGLMGKLGNDDTRHSLGSASPVINISPEYAEKLQGSGTIEIPYEIKK